MEEAENEIVETEGISYNEEDEEARIFAEKERQKEIQKWKQQMQENALIFLSDTDSIVKYRKRRNIDKIIKHRMDIIQNRNMGIYRILIFRYFLARMSLNPISKNSSK